MSEDVEREIVVRMEPISRTPAKIIVGENMCLTKIDRQILERETRDEEKQRHEAFARSDWLRRIENALWRQHGRHTLNSWEEMHYYDGARRIIQHRDAHE